MKIWLINNYNSLPEHGQMTRHYNFAKCLKEMGNRPVVFVGSHTHNTDDQLIEGPEKFKVYQEEPFPWVLVKTLKYGKNRKKQVISMFQFYLNGKRAARYAVEHCGKPDAVLGSSAHPLAALLAVRLAKKYGCCSVVEIRDLWPESIVAYGIAGPHNPAVIALRWLEKWLYKNADAVIFTMEGAYDYIVEQGWEKDVPRSKVFYINNGVDLEIFDYNREHYRVEDSDLDDPDTFKVIYMGSIRKANHIENILDAARMIQRGGPPDIRFLIYGDGEERAALEEDCPSNVIFKGFVRKEQVPYILSKSSVNLWNFVESALLRYGASPNKLFDYLASGRPTIGTGRVAYNPLLKYRAGIEAADSSPESIRDAVLEMYHMPEKDRALMGAHAREAAKEYDFKRLSERLMEIAGD